MGDIVTLGGKDNSVEPGNRISTLLSSALDLYTSKSIGNIFSPWVVYVYDMVTLDSKDNCLEPGNCSPVRSTFDLKINREHLPPMGSPFV
jgi:hypothetical protein